MTPTEHILAQLPDAKRNGNGWTARCPAHNDRKASLSIGEGDDGRALIKCMAGCETSAVVVALGMSMCDLFPPRDGNGSSARRDRRIAATYTYTDEAGAVLFEVVRFAPKDFRQRQPDGKGGFTWSIKGVRRVLYRLPDLIDAGADSFLFITEGEKDADRLVDAGCIATTTAGGAGKAHLADLTPLHGRHVVILPDADAPGREHAEQVAALLHGEAASVRVLHLPDLPPKGDASDWFNAGHDADELVTLAEAAPLWEPGESTVDDNTPKIEPIPFGELRRQYPQLNPPVINGLLRAGETCNIIGASKVGKSWLAYNIGLCIRSGRPLFDTFDCTPGPVLLIDNELHPPTIAHRIPQVADALNIPGHEYDAELDVIPLRGRGVTLPALGGIIGRIEAGHYKAIVCDAWYRFVPVGMNENSNADMMNLYNALDRYAGQTEAAWIVIHHSSKGNQGEKAVTDVGAGAGAQSRAADSHLVLRPHEEPGCVVLDAAVRSFPPVEPLVLRWTFPVWARAYSLDPSALKGRKPRHEERQDERDAEGMDTILKLLSDDRLTLRQVRKETGYGKTRTERLLDCLEARGKVASELITVRGNTTYEYRSVN